MHASRDAMPFGLYLNALQMLGYTMAGLGETLFVWKEGIQTDREKSILVSF
jgi:hypothetical protein